MEHNVFEQPVWVYSGLNIPFALQSVAQAHSFLLDTPRHLRSTGYSGAVNACLAALRGEVDAETARAAFTGYARRQGILISETDEFAAAMAGARPASRPGA